MHSQQLQSVSQNPSHFNAYYSLVTHHSDRTFSVHAGFLKSPHIVFRLVLKTFSIVVKPIVSPFIAWYLRILNLAVCILSFTMKILHYLAKIFHTS